MAGEAAGGDELGYFTVSAIRALCYPTLGAIIKTRQGWGTQGLTLTIRKQKCRSFDSSATADFAQDDRSEKGAEDDSGEGGAPKLYTLYKVIQGLEVSESADRR